jgi:hypothetical protein
MSEITDSEKNKIRKTLEKSYFETNKLLKEIYEFEYFFRVEKDRQNLSNSAHNKKDELIEKLNNVMSLSLRGRTRKRIRGPFNVNNSNGSASNRSGSNRSGSNRSGSLTPGHNYYSKNSLNV